MDVRFTAAGTPWPSGMRAVAADPVRWFARDSWWDTPMEGIVELATQPVLERLRTWLKDQAAETIDGWELPEVIHAVDSEFTAAHRRRRIPRFTSYWRIEQPGEEPPY